MNLSLATKHPPWLVLTAQSIGRQWAEKNNCQPLALKCGASAVELLEMTHIPARKKPKQNSCPAHL